MDGAVSEAGLDVVACLKLLGIANGLAILKGDAVAAAEQEGRVKTLGFLLDELKAVLLCHQPTIEQDRQSSL